MSTPNDAETGKPEGRQSGSQVLIGFGLVVLVLFAVMLNQPARTAEWTARLLGRKSPTRVCMDNLKQIDGAMQSWALENRKALTDTYSLADILPYLKGSVLPVCPLGGKYSPAKTIADMPTCSITGHTF